MREQTVEAYLVRRVREELKGTAYKFTSLARRNVPDRKLALPGGRTVYVECKAPGKKPTKGQEREIKRLRALGFRVEVTSTKDQVDRLIEELKA